MSDPITTTAAPAPAAAQPQLATATVAAEAAGPDLAALEERVTALEGKSRNILLRLHDKIVGYRTVIFGTIVGIGPAIADYFGQVDWKSFGLAPLTALAIGALIVGFRAVTSTPLGARKA